MSVLSCLWPPCSPRALWATWPPWPTWSQWAPWQVVHKKLEVIWWMLNNQSVSPIRRYRAALSAKNDWFRSTHWIWLSLWQANISPPLPSPLSSCHLSGTPPPFMGGGVNGEMNCFATKQPSLCPDEYRFSSGALFILFRFEMTLIQNKRLA